MLLTAFMLALVVNSFALKVYVYLVEKPSPECFEVMLIITETDATAEWVQASGNATIGG